MNALSPARSVQELDLAVSDFCAVLTDEQRRDLSSIRSIPDADSIFVFTAQLDYKNRSRRGQSVGSRVSKVLQSTRDFCAVVDTYVSSHPEVAALVWGSVKLTIQIVLNYTSYYEAISGLFLRLGHLCPLFAEYGALYPSSKQLQKSVADFHASIVRCCKHVIEAIQRPWHNQVFQAFYTSFEQEFQPDIDDTRRCSDSVKDAVNLAKAHADTQEWKLQAKERTAASKHRDLLEVVLKKQSLERKQQLLEALCSHRPEKLLKQSQRKRFRNTANWIFEIAEFRSWAGTSDAPLLWCSGKIGSGKTVVAASVVDHLFLEKGRSDCLVSYFFIHSSDQESLKAKTLMKSILRQRLPPATQLSDEMEERLRRLSDDGDLNDIVAFICDITSASVPHYIVLDGLDECEKRDQVRVLQALSSLVALAANTKICLVSRESLREEIRSCFPTIRQISTDHPGVHDDIIHYIRGILEDKIKIKELRVGDSGLITEIEDALTGGADGMFLWVFFQVQELCQQTCDEDIRHTIANLPKDLEETFRRVLRRISSRRNSEMARRALLWIAAAVRPLTLEELREAMAIEIGQQYTKMERLCNNINTILLSCENLLQIDEEDSSVQFAHHSIRQFLVEPPAPPQKRTDYDLRVFHVDLEEADHFIGEICVTYLHFSDFQTALSRLPKPIALPHPRDIALTTLGFNWDSASKFGLKFGPRGASTSVRVSNIIKSREGPTLKVAYNNTHPFLKYVSANWILHTKNFWDRKSKTWNLWKKVIINGHALAITPWEPEASNCGIHIHEWAIRVTHPALIYLIDSASVFWRPTGWEIICEAIPDNILAIRGIELRCRKPDEVASYIFPECPTLSSLDIANKLLAAGADVSGTSWDSTVLQDAANNGYLHIIGMLARAIECPVGNNILADAAWNGDMDIVETILAAGVDLGKWGLDVALWNAARRRHLDILKSLQKGGDTDAVSRAVKFAFNNASTDGNFNIIDALLTAGVDANIILWNSGTALHNAATYGHLNIVERLLTAGASVDIQNWRDATPLLLAAGRGYLDILNRLLTAGADVNFQSPGGATPLHVAVEEGHLYIVERLLKAGASVNIRSLWDRTSLHLAAEKGHLDIVERLLTAGIDINAKDCRGRAAVHKAAESGHLNILERLLAAGADPFEKHY